MKVSNGITRTVLAIGGIVVKFPSLRHGRRYFVMGMLGNVLEREHWRLYQHPQLAPAYHCGPFGLWLVMKRYRNIVNRQLTEDEKRTLPFIGTDDNGANVAIEGDKLILVDYGNPTWFYFACIAEQVEKQP